MILTCPACSMRYMVSDAAVGPEGRTVRCASCGHQWHQDPEPVIDDIPDFSALLREEEEREAVASVVSAPDDVPEDDIPESVKPVPEDAPLSDEEEKRRAAIDRLIGYGGALVVLLALLVVAVVFRAPIAKVFPPSTLAYELLGLEIKVPGEGLVFDELKVRPRIVEGKEEFLIIGRVINLTSKVVDLPPITAWVLDNDGAMIAQWPVETEYTSLAGEAEMTFRAGIPANEEGASVRVGFSLKPVVSPEQASENQEAVHTEESLPPSDGGAPDVPARP